MKTKTHQELVRLTDDELRAILKQSPHLSRSNAIRAALKLQPLPQGRPKAEAKTNNKDGHATA